MRIPRRREMIAALMPIATTSVAMSRSDAWLDPVTGNPVATWVVVVGGIVVVVVGGIVVVVVAGTTAPPGTVGGVVSGDRQDAGVNALLSNVTAPVRASARPRTLAPVVTVIDAWARMVPTNDDPVPRVAELPTIQCTRHACAPLISTTALLDAVVSVK